MLTIELRPLPGLVGGGRRACSTPHDFDGEGARARVARRARAVYVARAAAADPAGHAGPAAPPPVARATSAGGAASTCRFSTAEPFRVVRLGCRGAVGAGDPGRRALRPRAGAALPGRRAQRGGRVLAPRRPRSARSRRATSCASTRRCRTSPPTLSGHELEITGDFARDTLYRVTLAPAAPARRRAGARSRSRRESEVFLFFPQRDALPALGRRAGHRRAPRSADGAARGPRRGARRPAHPPRSIRSTARSGRSPTRRSSVDESQRPPGPGEEPSPSTAAGRDIRPASSRAASRPSARRRSRRSSPCR